MGDRAEVARSPSRMDLQRQLTSKSKSPSSLAAQIPIFQRTRSRSAIERATPTPKFVVPLRGVHSAHGSNNSSSRRGRSNLSQSRKAHPSESRYSNRSFVEKSGRHHDVEVEDLKPEAPPPALPRQDSSVYRSTMHRPPSSPGLTSVPTPSVLTRAATAATLSAHRVHGRGGAAPPAGVRSTSSDDTDATDTFSATTQRVLWFSKALLHAGLGTTYAVIAALHLVSPAMKKVTALRTQILSSTSISESSTEASRLHSASCAVYAIAHVGLLLKMMLPFAALNLTTKRIRVAPAPTVAIASPSSSDEVRPFEQGSDSNSERGGEIRADVNGQSEGSPKKRLARPLSTSRFKRLIATLQFPVAFYQNLVQLEPTAMFERRYLAVRAVQLAVHTARVATLSSEVSNAGWAEFYIAVIVLSCWLPVLAICWSHGDSPARRFFCVAASLALDIVAALVIPLGLLHPYTKRHNAQEQYEPIPQQYSDEWIVRMLLDFQSLDETRPAVAILAVLFGIHIVLCLQLDPKSRWAVERSTANQPSHTRRVAPAPPVRTNSSSGSSVGLCQSWRVWVSPLTVVLFGWGLGVLVSHLVVSRTASSLSAACRVRTFPWYQTQPSCAMLELDCVALAAALQSQPTQDLTTMLNALSVDDKSIRYLVISNCDRLEMTPRLRDLDALVGLKVRTSTIVKWARDATLSGHIHRQLRMLSFARTTTSEEIELSETDPLVGVDSASPLQTLTMFQLCDASVTPSGFASFPIDSTWPNLAFLYLDVARLESFPTLITRLPLVELAVRGNAISEVPGDLFTHSSRLLLDRVWLDRNPLTELPPTGDADTMELVSLDSTRLASLPAWLDPHANTHVALFIGNTPLCANPAVSATASCVLRSVLSCHNALV